MNEHVQAVLVDPTTARAWVPPDNVIRIHAVIGNDRQITGHSRITME